VPALGNLKLAAPIPDIASDAKSALAAAIGGRPVWLAASTHAGEDALVLAAHARLRTAFPDALLIIAPRHPERGAAIAAIANVAPRRSQQQPIGDATVYVADTLGELGLFYASAPIALVGGSLLPSLKGHNPIEPAKLGAAILSGPHVESFEDVFEALFAAKAATRVTDAESIADAVTALWRDNARRTRQLEAARAFAEQGVEAFETTVAKIATLIPASGLAHAPA
jgi:3-deoxy-D-manno-octulosonic-acid transferase